MVLMVMYAIEWEKRAREEQERQVRAEWARWARVLPSAGESKQPEAEPRVKGPAFRKLLAALG